LSWRSAPCASRCWCHRRRFSWIVRSDAGRA
jgi:hypothetical protein